MIDNDILDRYIRKYHRQGDFYDDKISYYPLWHLNDLSFTFTYDVIDITIDNTSNICNYIIKLEGSSVLTGTFNIIDIKPYILIKKVTSLFSNYYSSRFTDYGFLLKDYLNEDYESIKYDFEILDLVEDFNYHFSYDFIDYVSYIRSLVD